VDVKTALLSATAAVSLSALAFGALPPETKVAPESMKTTEVASNEATFVGMTWNIYECQGWVQPQGACNTNALEQVAQILRTADPDWVCLQEVDTASKAEVGHDHVVQLAARTGLYPAFAGVFPHRHGGEWGEAILSKRKPSNVRSVPLPKEGNGPGRLALIAEYSDSVVCCTHLALEERDRLAEVEVLLQELKDFDKPVFLCGDFNSHPEDEPIRRLLTHFVLLSPAVPTWPSTAAKGQGECIDYILMDKAHAPSFPVVRQEVLDNRTASDHRAVLVGMRRCKDTVQGPRHQ